jgi:hypothetical protein
VKPAEGRFANDNFQRTTKLTVKFSTNARGQMVALNHQMERGMRILNWLIISAVNRVEFVGNIDNTRRSLVC